MGKANERRCRTDEESAESARGQLSCAYAELEGIRDCRKIS